MTWAPNWEKAGPISVKKQLFQWQEMRNHWANTDTTGYFGALREFWNGVKTNTPAWENQQTDWEAGIHTEYTLKLILIGLPEAPSPGRLGKEADDSELSIPFGGRDYYDVPKDIIILMNKGKLNGKTCRKTLYLLQDCSRCSVDDATYPHYKSVKETQQLHLTVYVYGRLHSENGMVSCDAEKGERAALDWVDRLNKKKKSLCNLMQSDNISNLDDVKPGVSDAILETPDNHYIHSEE